MSSDGGSYPEGSMITGMEHVGLCARDPRGLAEWYVSILAFRIVRALEERRTYFIRAPGVGMLEIYPAQHPTDPVDNVHRGLRHIALSASGIDAEVSRLRSAGVTVPPETFVKGPDMAIAFFRDPEGNLIHLVERAEDIPS
jgi:glyoxylase I family protein